MTGPSDKTLANLFRMLPSMAEIDSGSKLVRGPRFCCPACTKMFGRAKPGELISSRPCKACRYALKGGATIFVCDDQRYLVVKPKEGAQGFIRPDYVGKIIKISNILMDRVLELTQKKDLAEKSEKEDNSP